MCVVHTRDDWRTILETLSIHIPLQVQQSLYACPFRRVVGQQSIWRFNNFFVFNNYQKLSTFRRTKGCRYRVQVYDDVKPDIFFIFTNKQKIKYFQKNALPVILRARYLFFIPKTIVIFKKTRNGLKCVYKCYRQSTTAGVTNWRRIVVKLGQGRGLPKRTLVLVGIS